MNVWYW